MSRRKLTVAVVAIAGLLALGGCRLADSESGTVVSNRTILVGKVPAVRLCVKNGTGTHCGTVPFRYRKKCSVGAQWPACKSGRVG